jgi:hypothetical protein
MSQLHKVFISFHHALDDGYRTVFEFRFGNKFGVIIPGAVNDGDIDPTSSNESIRQAIRDRYLRDTSVTVVLIGAQTWQRKHVDWEIGSSIRQTAANPRSGLLGILLPSYHERYGSKPGKYNRHTIPPRLWDNVEIGFAQIQDWSNDADVLQTWVHDAYLRKARLTPTNARDSFKNNRSGAEWQ